MREWCNGSHVGLIENLSAFVGNLNVDGVKVGEPLTDYADGNAELRSIYMKQRYTNQQFIDAVSKATNVRSVLGILGLKEAGGNYTTVKNKIKTLNLDTAHFVTHWQKEQRRPVKTAVPLVEVLKNGTTVQSYKLKIRLLKAGLKYPVCENCKLDTWLSNPIPLELDHINGNNTDNRLENLRLLCPNCHALTDTYRGKKLTKCRDETAPT